MARALTFSALFVKFQGASIKMIEMVKIAFEVILLQRLLLSLVFLRKTNVHSRRYSKQNACLPGSQKISKLGSIF